MGELEEMLNGVLSDPEQMERIGSLARSLMGGEPAPDAAMLSRVGGLLSRSADGKQAVFEAMLPYLSEKRREKMYKAMKLARLARIARLAMDEMGDGNV